ncbi:anti-sigma factor family protein [Streptomyces litchfieldiae]|uniref:Zf-HC2 domain-containing protein n=1 Tax=Streptomyces litchfieldiae TaxID=3075543 RepID=A0ABU2MLN6_9ACTN|nr:zf-HC2 domain-containing protein [Streptomyces sp. DSM 44938]MDT0342521.1 zf-HC2 domain-containing protein [Streptomyces sp. DSM 44938]
MTSAQEPGQADHHLGESLAALVDGELSHDSRDRVLAHLATCPSCKAEADAQRELKSVFAESVLPGPSDGLLARLQSLPAVGAEPPADSSDAPGGREEQPPAQRRSSVLRLDLLPGGKQRESALGPPRLGGERGFRIHEPGAARVPRGHRLAFAAAGAVSLAAFAIGGAVSSVGAGTATAGSSQPGTVAAGSNVSQVAMARTQSGRSEEERELPEAIAAQAAGLALLSAPAGPIGSSGQLFPLLGAGLKLAPLADPSAGPSILGAVSPR